MEKIDGCLEVSGDGTHLDVRQGVKLIDFFVRKLEVVEEAPRKVKDVQVLENEAVQRDLDLRVRVIEPVLIDLHTRVQQKPKRDLLATEKRIVEEQTRDEYGDGAEPAHPGLPTPDGTENIAPGIHERHEGASQE